MDWYKQNFDSIFQKLNVDSNQGLSQDEVNKRLKEYGYNQLKEEKKDTLLQKIFYQLSNILVIILIISSVISFFVGEVVDSIIIISIVIANAILGVVQEGKAEKSLEALKKMSSPNGRVLRDGEIVEVPADTLVPGDVAMLETGDIVPADIRLINTFNLKIDESSLTGESVPAEKNSNTTFSKDTPLGDRKNMAYTSTIVTYGRGKGIVVETGESAEIGKIATTIQDYEEEATPLQTNLNQLGKYLGIGCLIISTLIFLIGYLQGRNILDIFMIAVSLAVAAIPEGLPAIVTIVLALGMNSMVKRNAIVKKLLAVETLGSTTAVCSDKTGTLTQNEMTVVKAYTDNKLFDITGKGYGIEGDFLLNNNKVNLENEGNLNLLLKGATLCNDAILNYSDGEEYTIVGDPTEGSLLSLSEKGGFIKDDLNKKYPRIKEIPFDSDRKLMTTFHNNLLEGKIVSFTKGAPDIILEKANKIYLKGEVIEFTDEIKKKVLDINKSFSQDALRVLAFAYKTYEELPKNISSESIENNFVFLGLVGMIDPPREEAKDSIKLCHKAGIKTIMITGDYKETAFAIAKDLDMANNPNEVMTGQELNNLSDDELKEKVELFSVYARVSPEHKVRIVDALKENGEVVAMTGDGVNDSPALRKADIGVSMGITGTDVAKNTAEVILTDDNFSSIVSAVEEGRTIYSNIKKSIFFLLSCNIGEIFIIFSSILLNIDIPLLPIQLLWLNLITDSFPALALGVEKGEEGIMSNPPRNPEEPVLDKAMALAILIQSTALALGVLLAFKWGLKTYGLTDLRKARTIAFTTLVLSELFRAYSSRSLKHSVFKLGIFSNKPLVYSTLFSFLLLLLVVYVPILQPLFKTFPLAFKDWSIILMYSIIPLIVGEIYKVLAHI
ncbi:MAG TPA: cation-translocating P-type ATPase [Tissierellales bacterium]|nr:cation-translocating P-type ATPase [Tissierellales bacterium]